MTVDEQTRKAGASDPVDAEIERLSAEWPQEFRLGYRFGILGRADEPCDGAGKAPSRFAQRKTQTTYACDSWSRASSSTSISMSSIATS
jgi:hypothetical protein